MASQLLERRARVRSETDSAFGVLRHLDLVLVGATLLLSVIGVAVVYSASRGYAISSGLSPDYYLKRQVAYVVLGAIVMMVCTFVDYRRLEEWGYFLYGAILFSLLVVLVIGHSSYGAERWISLGPLTLQPSEFGVLAVIVVIGTYVQRREAPLNWRAVGAMLGLVVAPVALIAKQPDLSTAIVVVIVTGFLLVFAGVRLRILLALGGCALFAIGLFVLFGVTVLHGYQASRITSFLHQSHATSAANYNLTLSKEAIGAGGLRGTGFGRGQVTNGAWVPVQYADFIFSAIGEQFGFIGCAAVIGLFALVVLRIFRAFQLARDSLGRLICGGVLAFLFFSVFENIGMTIGLTPIAGIPLPFISYGGSALLAFFAAIGLVANVELRRIGIR